MKKDSARVPTEIWKLSLGCLSRSWEALNCMLTTKMHKKRVYELNTIPCRSEKQMDIAKKRVACGLQKHRLAVRFFGQTWYDITGSRTTKKDIACSCSHVQMHTAQCHSAETYVSRRLLPLLFRRLLRHFGVGVGVVDLSVDVRSAEIGVVELIIAEFLQNEASTIIIMNTGVHKTHHQVVWSWCWPISDLFSPSAPNSLSSKSSFEWRLKNNPYYRCGGPKPVLSPPST